MQRGKETMKLLEAEGRAPTGAFDQKTGEREELVIARRIKKTWSCSHGSA